jgi:hypothetical protein
MRIIIGEKWTEKHKKSIDCNNPRGFSQKAHCAGRKARQSGRDTKSDPVDEEIMDVSSDGDHYYLDEYIDDEIPPVEVDEELDRCARIAKRKYKVWPSAYASGAAVKCRKGKIWKGLKEGKVSSTLSSIAKGDQELRNEFAALIKSRGGWSQQLVDEFVAEKGTDKEDVFGDKQSGRQEQFANLFSSLTDDDYNDFSEEDWSNFWLVAQHADSNRPLQKKAQEILLNYKGEESGYYRYITDRISCAETGSQKYGTQAGCRVEIEEKQKRKYKPNFKREKEQGLHGWFARNKGKGWVNCRTGGPCGRESADKGGKYPACRPTMAQCKSAGKGPLRRKKSSKQISWTGDKKE